MEQNFNIDSLCDMSENEALKMIRKRKLLQQYLENHPYKISKQSDGYYHTYLPTKPKRKHIKKSTVEEIQNALFDYYYNDATRPTVEVVFEQYMDYNVERGQFCEATEIRYRDIFKKFYYDTDFSMAYRILEDITEEELGEFVLKMIKKYKLSMKAFQNFRTVTKGVYKYGKNHLNLKTFSISAFFDDLDTPNKAMNSNKKKHIKEEMIYTDEEYKKIREYALQNLDIKNIGILICFETGLRAGEISALKYTDFIKEEDSENGVFYFLNVSKTETRTKEEVCRVKETTKSEAGTREMVINEFTFWLAEEAHKMNPNGEFLLMTNNGQTRQRGNYFSKRLISICDKLGIPRKSMHKIRRYYATTLLDNISDDAFVQNQVGHSDIATTRGYYQYCKKGKVDKIDALYNALNSRKIGGQCGREML